MNRRAPAFRYRLEPLLRADRWAGNLLSIELRRAGQLVEEKSRLQRETQRRIEQTQDELRALHRDQATIPIERRRLLFAYLDEQYSVAQTRAADLARAETLFEQIMAQRRERQLKIRGLENHRDRELRAHEAVHQAAELRDADDRWLLSRR